ncbi:MAG: hypothetical protein FJ267_18080, partial [Planctomycetes bacterium]|nr:hypothetical protein [Planctomycetota bacterium]
MHHLCRLTLLLFVFLPLVAIAKDEVEPTDKDVQFFETTIRPLLIEKCQSCHGAKKQQGSLRMDHRDSLLTGGDS